MWEVVNVCWEQTCMKCLLILMFFLFNSTDQPRVFHSLPATLPPPLLPQNPPAAENHRENPPPTAPLRPNLRPPSTIPIEGEPPPRRRLTPLTPMVHAVQVTPSYCLMIMYTYTIIRCLLECESRSGYSSLSWG